MVSQNVDRILQAVQALSDDERRELRSRLNDHDAREEELRKREQVRRQLVAEGLLSHVPPRGKDPERFRDWQPVAIKGEPLSETIIEERR